MKMRIKWGFAGVLLGMMSAQAGLYDDVADYRRLTKDNLPHVQVMIQEALEFHSNGRMNHHVIKKRLKWSYLLPTVEVRYGQTDVQQYQQGTVRLIDETEYPNVYTAGDVNRYENIKDQYTTINQNSSWMPFWHVYANWDLNRLLFNRDTFYAGYSKEQESYYQQRMVKEIIKLYGELDNLLQQRTGTDDIEMNIRISAPAVKLDFLTGDYLSKTILGLGEQGPAGESPATAETASETDAAGQLQQLTQHLNANGGHLFEARIMK